MVPDGSIYANLISIESLSCHLCISSKKNTVYLFWRCSDVINDVRSIFLTEITEILLFPQKWHSLLIFFKKWYSTLFFDKITNFSVWWWRHKYIFSRFITILLVCARGYARGNCSCASHVCRMWVLGFEFSCICISSVFASFLLVYAECAPQACAASVRRNFRRMRALCVRSLIIRMRIACLNAYLWL